MSFSVLAQPLSRQHVATLILIPLIMATINSNWLYTVIGYLDPWYNIGYFLHYDDPAFRTAYYKVSRLSWLLPGWILYHVFHPVVANLLLHLGALLIATIFVYLTLARLVARDIAFLAALFLTIYYPFHGSGGWDYQTTGAGAYYALTLYFLTRAAQSQLPARSLFVAGMAFAATFHADILFINTVPVLVAHYLIISRKSRALLGRLMRAVAPAFAGFVMLTLALCVINWSVGRNFLFFQPILDIVFDYVANPSQMRRWWSPWDSGWFMQRSYYYLDVPLATLLGGAWVLLSNRHRAQRQDIDPIPAFLVAQYLILALVWIVWQSLGAVALQPDYFAYPLIIPCILGLAGIMAFGQTHAPLVAHWWRVPALLLLAFVPGADVLDHLPGQLAISELPDTFGASLRFIVALLLVFMMVRVRNRQIPIIAAIILFQTCNPPFARVREFYSFDDRCPMQRTAFAAMITLDRLVSQFTSPERVWLWMGPQEIAVNDTGCRFDLLDLRGSAIALSLSPLGSATDASASDIPDAQLAALKPGDWVAIATTDPSQASDLAKRLGQLHRVAGPTQQVEVSVMHIPLFLQLLPVVAAPSHL